MQIRSAEAGPLVEIASVPAVIDGVDADVTYGFAGSGADVILPAPYTNVRTEFVTVDRTWRLLNAGAQRGCFVEFGGPYVVAAAFIVDQAGNPIVGILDPGSHWAKVFSTAWAGSTGPPEREA